MHILFRKHSSIDGRVKVNKEWEVLTVALQVGGVVVYYG